MVTYKGIIGSNAVELGRNKALIDQYSAATNEAAVALAGLAANRELADRAWTNLHWFLASFYYGTSSVPEGYSNILGNQFRPGRRPDPRGVESIINHIRTHAK